MKSKTLLSASSPLVGKFSKVVIHVLRACLLVSGNLTLPVFRNDYVNVAFAHDEDDKNHDDGGRKHKDKILLKTVSDAPDPFSVAAAQTAEFQSQYEVKRISGLKDDSKETNKRFFVRQTLRITDAATGTEQVTLKGETEVLPWPHQDDAAKVKFIAQSNVLTGEITVDNTPPVITNLLPSNGTTLVDNPRPEISAQFSDNLTGVDVASVEILLDGSSVTASSAIAASGFTFVPSGVLSAGVHTVSVIVEDLAGNPDGAFSTFTLEETSVIPPPAGPDAGYVHGTVYDSFMDSPLQGAVVTVNGVEGAVLTGAQGKFIFPIIDYPQENKKTVVVTIEKEGYTYAQRRVTVTSTRDIAVDPAYLTPLDGRVTVITSTGGIATNATGTIVQSYVCDSFGNIVLQTGSLTNSYTYTGREFDPESGVYYYRARYIKKGLLCRISYGISSL